MIQQSAKAGHISTVPGEVTAFTIDVTGTMFRTLIEKLYSNTVGSPLREVASNAYDAHVAAGIPDKPFVLTLPTVLDPVVKVRDFGPGMTHDEVTHLYTALGRSTKGGTNDQVGAFGLGSKSPLAYGDTFTVRAYDGQEQRVYTVQFSTDGIPALVHAATVPSVEDRGIEVSYPVRSADVNLFTTAAKRLVYGFDTPPVIDGPALPLAQPVLTGDGWKVYRSSESGFTDGTWAKIGCAVYPVDRSFGCARLDYGYMALVDVPIGAFEITPSRESLLYDERTKAAQRLVMDRVADEVRAAVEEKITAATSNLQLARAVIEWGNISALARHRLSTIIRFSPSWPVVRPSDFQIARKAFPADRLHRVNGGRNKGDAIHQYDIRRVSGLRIVVDDGVKVPRRNLRLSLAAKRFGSELYLLHDDDTGRARRRMQRILGLADSQIMMVSDLPDVVVSRAPRAPKAKIGAWAPGKLWVRRERTTLMPEIRFSRNFHSGDELTSDRVLNSIATTLGVNLSRDVEILTNQDIKRLAPDPASEFTVWLRSEFLRTAVPANMKAVVVCTVVARAVGYYANDTVIHELFGTDYPTDEVVTAVVMTVSNLPLTDPTRQEYDRLVEEVETKLNRYPMLLNTHDASHFKDYIKLVDSATTPQKRKS